MNTIKYLLRDPVAVLIAIMMVVAILIVTFKLFR